MTCIIVPDNLVNQKFTFNDNGPVTVPTIFFEDGKTLPWPPDIDWIFIEKDPFKYGFTQVTDATNGITLLLNRGLIHEQFHLLHPKDLYLISLDWQQVYKDGDQVMMLKTLLPGWSELNINTAWFAHKDIMNCLTCSPYINLTTNSTLQIAIARTQGIYNAMRQEADYKYLSKNGYKISIVDASAGDITPKVLTDFGTPLEEDDYKQFGFTNTHVSPSYVPSNNPTGDGSSFKSFMLGAVISQNRTDFLLPIPTEIGFLYRITHPIPTEYTNDPFTLTINVRDVEKNIAWYTRYERLEKDRQLGIDINLMTEKELHDLEGNQTGDNGVIIATAKIQADPRLFKNGDQDKVYLVWTVQSLKVD